MKKVSFILLKKTKWSFLANLIYNGILCCQQKQTCSGFYFYVLAYAFDRCLLKVLQVLVFHVITFRLNIFFYQPKNFHLKLAL